VVYHQASKVLYLYSYHDEQCSHVVRSSKQEQFLKGNLCTILLYSTGDVHALLSTTTVAASWDIQCSIMHRKVMECTSAHTENDDTLYMSTALMCRALVHV
jgi:hypothetical protein